jgi:hypothetical protein
MADKLTRTELKTKAQEVLMTGIANQLGYWNPEDWDEPRVAEQLDEFREIMKREADRVAKLFGYDESWSN